MPNYNGINYSKPTVLVLNDSGIGVAEIAARTCYDSFENSENACIKNFVPSAWNKMSGINPKSVNNIPHSELLKQLAWVHHHHSILEHIYISYYIQGTSRGVLQEHARHRMQNISVRSTRYTMSSVINAYVATLVIDNIDDRHELFRSLVLPLDLFVTTDIVYNSIEIDTILQKLDSQVREFGRENFLESVLSKENLATFQAMEATGHAKEVFVQLEAGKKKRNVGDSLKHIVTDNWKVDMVVTFNLRSLKNYFDLRDSGAAWFQIRWLAEAMKEVTPIKYLKLIDKNHKDK